jgi:hypothetical protein
MFMGAVDYVLPFRRGSTWKDGQVTDLITPDINTAFNLAGTLVKTVDSSNRPLTLRIVKLSAAVTAARKCLAMDAATAGYITRVSTGIATVAGVVAKPLDDAYVVGATLAQYDLVYVVDEGYVTVQAALNASGTATWDTDDPLAVNASGQLRKALTNEYVVARSQASAPTADSAALCYVTGGLAMPQSITI